MCVKCIWVPFHVGLRHNATADLLAKDAWRLPPRVMIVLSPCHAASPGSKPLSYLCGVAGILRGPTVSPSTITSPPQVHVPLPGSCGSVAQRCLSASAAVQIAGLEGEPPFTQRRLCRALLTNTIEHYWVACPLFGTSYPKVCGWMLSVAIFWCRIFLMRFSCVTLDLVAFPDTLCPAWHLLLVYECGLVGGVREWVSV